MMKKIKKEWIGKFGNSVYKIEYDETSIYPQGVEVNLKLMDSNLWLDGYNKQQHDKHRKELGIFLDRLAEVYSRLQNFEWDVKKDEEFAASIKKNVEKSKKEKKESGV
jgi:hypothetical protein